MKLELFKKLDKLTENEKTCFEMEFIFERYFQTDMTIDFIFSKKKHPIK